MSKKINQKGSMADLGLIILLLIALFIMWYFTGGKNRSAVDDGPFFQIQGNQSVPSNLYE